MATKAQIRLAQQARKKAHRDRTPEEIQAIRAVRAGTRRPARPGGGQFGGLPPDLAALLAPMSQEDMTAQIGAMVSSQYGPEQAALQAESARMAGQASGLSNQTSSLYQGLGQLMQPIAGNIEQTYQTAAESQSRFGQGFSVGLEMLANQQGGQDASFLAQQGAPQGQIDQTVQMGAGAPDVLNATGGYLPASTLNREGAAMTAYAQTLPAVAARAGQLEIASINNAAAQAQAEISSRMQALAAQLPGMRAKAAQDIWAQELEKAKMAWQVIESNRNYSLQVKAIELSAKQFGADVSNQEWDNLANIGINPMTGQPLPQEPPSGTGKLSPSGSKSAGIWVDVYGSPILDATGNTIPYKSGAGKGNKELVKARDAALDDLRGTFADQAEAMIVWNTLGGQKYRNRTKTPPWKQAYGRLLAQNKTLISDLAKRYKVSQARIRQMIREALLANDWKPPQNPTLGAVKPPKFGW